MKTIHRNMCHCLLGVVLCPLWARPQDAVTHWQEAVVVCGKVTYRSRYECYEAKGKEVRHGEAAWRLADRAKPVARGRYFHGCPWQGKILEEGRFWRYDDGLNLDFLEDDIAALRRIVKTVKESPHEVAGLFGMDVTRKAFAPSYDEHDVGVGSDLGFGYALYWRQYRTGYLGLTCGLLTHEGKAVGLRLTPELPMVSFYLPAGHEAEGRRAMERLDTHYRALYGTFFVFEDREVTGPFDYAECVAVPYRWGYERAARPVAGYTGDFGRVLARLPAAQRDAFLELMTPFSGTSYYVIGGSAAASSPHFDMFEGVAAHLDAPSAECLMYSANPVTRLRAIQFLLDHRGRLGVDLAAYSAQFDAIYASCPRLHTMEGCELLTTGARELVARFARQRIGSAEETVQRGGKTFRRRYERYSHNGRVYRHGVWTEESQQDQEESVVHYRDGWLHGPAVWWDSAGRRLAAGSFRYGQPWDGQILQKGHVVTFEGGVNLDFVQRDLGFLSRLPPPDQTRPETIFPLFGIELTEAFVAQETLDLGFGHRWFGGRAKGEGYRLMYCEGVMYQGRPISLRIVPELPALPALPTPQQDGGAAAAQRESLRQRLHNRYRELLAPHFSSDGKGRLLPRHWRIKAAQRPVAIPSLGKAPAFPSVSKDMAPPLRQLMEAYSSCGYTERLGPSKWHDQWGNAGGKSFTSETDGDLAYGLEHVRLFEAIEPELTAPIAKYLLYSQNPATRIRAIGYLLRHHAALDMDMAEVEPVFQAIYRACPMIRTTFVCEPWKCSFVRMEKTEVAASRLARRGSGHP